MTNYEKHNSIIEITANESLTNQCKNFQHDKKWLWVRKLGMFHIIDELKKVDYRVSPSVLYHVFE